MFKKITLRVVAAISLLLLAQVSNATSLSIVDLFATNDHQGLRFNGEDGSTKIWLRGGSNSYTYQQAQHLLDTTYQGWHIATLSEILAVNYQVFGFEGWFSIWGDRYPNYYSNPLAHEFSLLGIPYDGSSLKYLDNLGQVKTESFYFYQGDNFPGGDRSVSYLMLENIWADSGNFALVKDVPEPAPVALLIIALGALSLRNISRSRS